MSILSMKKFLCLVISLINRVLLCTQRNKCYFRTSTSNLQVVVMKSKRIIHYLIITLLGISMMGMMSCHSTQQVEPLSNCTPSNVEKVTIEYGIHDYTLQADELAEFLVQLNNLKAFEIDNTVKESDGDSFWKLIIELKTGQTVLLNIASPYIVVNEEGYRVESATCTELQNYIQNIVEKNFND